MLATLYQNWPENAINSFDVKLPLNELGKLFRLDYVLSFPLKFALETVFAKPA